MFSKFLHLIFPNVCGFCNRINNEGLCKKCEQKILKYQLANLYNYKSDNSKYFDYLYCALKYDGIVREKIISYKYGEKAYLYKTFVKIIIKNRKIYRFLKLYDIIIPVPMYRSKESVRGYNQCLLLAKELSNSLNIKLDRSALIKNKNTKVQSTLPKIERQKNVKGAFEVKNKEKFASKKILLVDDIYTTGNTANECARIIKQAGAKEIFVLAIAKD